MFKPDSRPDRRQVDLKGFVDLATFGNFGECFSDFPKIEVWIGFYVGFDYRRSYTVKIKVARSTEIADETILHSEVVVFKSLLFDRIYECFIEKIERSFRVFPVFANWFEFQKIFPPIFGYSTV